MEIVVFKEKWGKQYFDISTPELRGLTFNYVLEERIKNGYYLYKTEQVAELALDDNQSEQFLFSRKHLSYESFDIVEVRQIKENV